MGTPPSSILTSRWIRFFKARRGDDLSFKTVRRYVTRHDARSFGHALRLWELNQLRVKNASTTKSRAARERNG